MIRTFNKKAILTRLDRLESAVPLDRLVNAFISRDMEQYKLECRLWNGIKYSGTKSIITRHDTFESAKREFERMQKEYPSNEDVLLFVDNMDEELLFMDDDSYRDMLKGMSDEDVMTLTSDLADEEVMMNILTKNRKEDK